MRPAKGGRQDYPAYQPRLVLRSGLGSSHPSDSAAAIPIAPDGGFEITGVPAGDWTLHVEFWEFDSRGSGGSSSYDVLDVRGLRDGERREVEVDLGRFVKGELRGQLLRDGVAVAGARLIPRGSIDDGRGGQKDGRATSVTTDAEGRFAVKLLPGRWWLNLWSSGQTGMGVPLAEQFEVRSGATVETVIHYAPAALAVRVLDAQGRPLAQRDVTITAGEDFGAQRSTDAEGRFVLDPAPRVALEFFIWPAELANDTQRAEAMAQSSWTAVLARRIRLGSHVVAADKPRDEVTLRVKE